MYIVSVSHWGKGLCPERKLGQKNANYPASNFRVCKWFKTQFCHQNPCSSPCFLIICFSRTVLKEMEFWPLLNYFIFATAFIIKIEGLVKSAIKIFPLVRVFKKQIWVPTGHSGGPCVSLLVYFNNFNAVDVPIKILDFRVRLPEFKSWHHLKLTEKTLACLCVQSLGCVRIFEILWAVACQAPLSMEFFKQEY